VIGRNVPFGAFCVPTEVVSRHGWLLWDERAGSVRRGFERRILDDFLPLADCSDKHILEFARHWGILDLCIHDVPRAHTERSYRVTAIPDGAVTPYACSRKTFHGMVAESIDSWRRYARLAQALLMATASLRLGERTRPAVQAALRDSPFRPVWTTVFSNNAQRTRLNRIRQRLEDWLAIAGVRPVPTLRGNRFETLYMGGLFGCIGFQLSAAISDESYELCSSCGRFYSPTRRPRAGDRRLCGNAACLARAARDRKRKSRTNARERSLSPGA
jgi:hypothetical protein